MHVIRVTNVCNALPIGIDFLLEHGEHLQSRNGPVLVAPGPVTTVYEMPTERVLFASARDANPFFHLAEAFWMLRGRNDPETLNHFVHDFGDRFADHGEIRGAYGFRWRSHYEMDQIEIVVARLKQDKFDRRSVIGMWDVGYDLFDPSEIEMPKDIPCNTHMYLRVHDGLLNLTVCCRSNDIIWGAYGANAVHFSILQEYLAARIGIGVGRLYQMSNNYHAYMSEIEKIQKRANNKDLVFALYDDRYTTIDPIPLVTNPESFDLELESGNYLENRFLSGTYQPMMHAFDAWKRKENPYVFLNEIEAEDWKTAAIEWIVRRTKT